MQEQLQPTYRDYADKPVVGSSSRYWLHVEPTPARGQTAVQESRRACRWARALAIGQRYLACENRCSNR